jgi:hypothetical protein
MRDRKSLRALCAELRPGELTEWQCAEIKYTLGMAAEGYDIRRLYHIKPKAGAPPSTRASQKWLTLWFLRLRLDEPEKLEKEHRGTIAKETGLSDSRIRAIIRDNRAKMELIAPTVTLEQVANTAKVLIEHARLIAN